MADSESAKQPGQPFGDDPNFYLGGSFAQLENIGHTLSAVNLTGHHTPVITFDMLTAAVKKGWDRAIAENQEKPADHSTFSSKLQEGHKQLMASHNLI